MRNTLKINEAISRYQLKTGKHLQWTDIARQISTPDTYQATYQKIQRYANGNVQFFDMAFISLLSDVLECTPAYLLGLEDADENI